MTPERWQRLNEIFDAAVQLPPPQRAVFLAQTCGVDLALRAEAEALLAAEGNRPLDLPVGEMAADLLSIQSNSPTAGTRFGSYEIIRRLGAGGMGEVYLACDERLGRFVALKMLAPYFNSHTDRLDLFQAEARAASALNHPNILVVYELGEWDGRRFMATEYVEGRTLREELAMGPLAAERVMDIAIQIAEALAAAHQASIVHRDIKPENIMLRPDGYVKVLDFGLAKLTEFGGDAELAIMGTVNYMSPEQAAGGEVDARSDIYSLGVVLYELISGRRPAKGQDSVTTVPPGLLRIIQRCLAESACQRYSSMAELAGELKSLRRQRDLAQAGSPIWRRSILAMGAGAAASAALGYRAWSRRPPVDADRTVITRFPTTSDVVGGYISPDGRYVACIHDAGGLSSLSMKERSPGGRDIPINPPEPYGYWGVSFSPDGKYLYLVLADRRRPSGGVLYRQAALGGERLKLAERVDGVALPDAAGQFLIFKRYRAQQDLTGLMMIRADGSGERLLQTSDAGYAFDCYNWTTDGKSVQYFSGTSYASAEFSLSELTPGGGPARRILTGQQGPLRGGTPTGRNGLYVMSVDPESGLNQIWYLSLPDGRRYHVTHDSNAYSYLTITADRKTILAPQQGVDSDIWMAPLGEHEQPPRRLTRGLGVYSGTTWISSSRLLYILATGSASDLWSSSVDGSDVRQVTSTGDVRPLTPCVSRDGRMAAFVGGKRGVSAVRVIDLGSGRVRDVVTAQTAGSAAFSADGEWLYYAARRVSSWAIWKVAVAGGEPERIAECDETVPVISPDGQTLAVTAAGDHAVRLIPIGPGGIERRFELKVPAGELQWAGNRSLYFGAGRGMETGVWLLPLDGGEPHQLARVDQERMFTFRVSPDGKQVVYVAGRSLVNLVQITNFG